MSGCLIRTNNWYDVELTHLKWWVGIISQRVCQQRVAILLKIRDSDFFYNLVLSTLKDKGSKKV